MEVMKMRWESDSLSPSFETIALLDISPGDGSPYTLDLLPPFPSLIGDYVIISFKGAVVLWNWLQTDILVWELPVRHDQRASSEDAL